MEPQQQRNGPHTSPPAWPLGCVLVLLNLLLMVNLIGLVGIVLASGAPPPWLAMGGPVALAALVPLSELLAGLWLRRGRNPYAGQALLWGFAFTLMAISVLTFIFNIMDRAAGII